MQVVRRIIAALFRKDRLALTGTAAASYVFGLFRDRLFARTFGAGQELDAYQAAFILPDFLLNFLIAGGLVAVFVPIFLEAKKEKPKEALAFARTITTVSTLLMFCVGVTIAFFAHPLARLVAPGFTATQTELLANLMRVLAFSPTIFAASNAVGAMLVAEQRFFTFGLSPVLYNLGIIVGTLTLAPYFGIMGVAYGTLAGALLHLAIRSIEVYKLRYPLRPALYVQLPQLREFIKLMIPKMFGHPVELATFWGFTMIASMLASGSVAILNFARNFQSVPISLVGISFATVSFSMLSQAQAEKNMEQFRAEYQKTFIHIAILSLLAAAAIWVLREFIIALFLGGGAFTAAAVHETAKLLGWFALSIPLEAVSHLQARAFYALKNTTLPVYAGVANLALSVGCAWLLLPHYGLVALPLGYAIGSLTKVTLLAALLPKRMKAY